MENGPEADDVIVAGNPPRVCAGVFERKTAYGKFVPLGMSPGAAASVRYRDHKSGDREVYCDNITFDGRCRATVPIFDESERVRVYVGNLLARCPFLCAKRKD